MISTQVLNQTNRRFTDIHTISLPRANKNRHICVSVDSAVFLLPYRRQILFRVEKCHPIYMQIRFIRSYCLSIQARFQKLTYIARIGMAPMREAVYLSVLQEGVCWRTNYNGPVVVTMVYVSLLLSGLELHSFSIITHISPRF